MSTITFGERPNSLRTTTRPLTDTVGYKLTGTTTFAMARALSAGYTPAIRAGLYRNNIECREVGLGVWDVDVTWGPYERKEPKVGDIKWSFDTTGETAHRTQALSHVATYPSSGPSHGGAIGVNEDGAVEGVDIVAPCFKWTENWKLALGDYSWPYASVLNNLTGCVNNSQFRGMAPGTVLFCGAQGTRSAIDPLILDVTYHFWYQQSGVNLSVDQITGINKVGWQYMWVEYQSSDDSLGHHVKKPKAAHIEQVYAGVDFSSIGIGVGSL